MKIQLALRLCLLCLILVLSACATDFPSHYSAEPIEATVIDADTKQPLERVIVTANWQLESGNPGGSFVVGQMIVMEAVTDKDGVFHFPAWGPIRRKEGLLLDKDPQLLFFKSGYEYRSLSNYGRSLEGIWKDPVRTSKWNGKTIELKRFSGTIAEYSRRFYRFNSDLEQIADRKPEDCNWKKLRQAIVATERERLKIVSQLAQQKEVNPNTVGSVYQNIIHNDNWYANKGCGSPVEFFRRYGP
ncbi:MAG: hypothetical protein ACJ8KO_03540 [Sulfurifustaceae bacterium]